MQGILLFSHGSTLCGAGRLLSRLARQLELEGAAAIVEPGYLNYSEPLFEEAFATCVERGATTLVVAPYFLVTGYFVQESLPPKIEAMRQRFPQVEVRVARALETHPLLALAVAHCAARAAPPQQWRQKWLDAPQFCRDNPQCPLFDTPACPHGAALAGGLPEPVGPLGPSAPEPTVAAAGESALLVMVHGSPRPSSNRTMFQVVEEVRSTGAFSQVEVGFMECNEPTIPEAIETLLAGGACRIVAVPYFLHAGTHVADDLPGLLEDAAAAHPEVQFLLGDYIGADPLVARVIADRVSEALDTERPITS